MASGRYGPLERSVSNWWTVGQIPAAGAIMRQGDPGVMNVWLRKVTNTIEAWGSLGGALPCPLCSWSLGVTGGNAGLVGLRINKADTSTAAPAFALHGFARVSTIPGM